MQPDKSAPLTADWGYLCEHEYGADALPDDDMSVPVESWLDVEQPSQLRADVTIWPTCVCVGLDRLTITGTLRDAKVFQSWLDCDPAIGQVMPSAPPYRYSHLLAGGLGFVQYSDGLGGGSRSVQMRYDFNPANVTPEQASRVLAHIKSPRASRIDVAVDYPRDLSGMTFDRARCSRAVWTGADGSTETVYLGAAGSKLRHRCYNKARERRSAGHVIPEDATWWRIEAVWRPVGLDDLLPEWLFVSLDIRGASSGISAPWRDYAALMYAAENPDWVRRLHWRHRKKVGEILKSGFLGLEPHPQDVYEKHRDALLTVARAYLGQCDAENAGHLCRAITYDTGNC